MESPSNKALLAAGTKCSAAQCGLHDYLPYKCQFCSQSFCSSHFRPAAHHCEKEVSRDRIAPPCPLCSTPVSVPVGEEPDTAMERHFETACEVMGQKKRGTPRCARHKCGKVLYSPIRCDSCKELFCPTHRHTSSHRCITDPASGASTSAPKIRPASIPTDKVENRLAALLRPNSVASPASTPQQPVKSPNAKLLATSSTSAPIPSAAAKDAPSNKSIAVSSSANAGPSSSSSIPNPFSKVDRWVESATYLQTISSPTSVPATPPSPYKAPSMQAILEDIASKPKPRLLLSSFLPPPLFGTA